MQNNYSKREAVKATASCPEMKTAVDTVPTDESKNVEQKSKNYGVVVNCERLNVRKAPSCDAGVMTIIPALTEVVIENEIPEENFYQVTLPSGMSGFCMKKFIAPRK